MKRVLSLLIANLLLLSLAACGKGNNNAPAATDGETIGSTVETSPQGTVPTDSTPAETTPEASTPAEPVPAQGWSVAYADLVEDFRKIIAYRASPDFEKEWDDGMVIPGVSDTLIHTTVNQVYRWGNMIVELPKAKTEADYGYILHDLNSDGTPELFWVHKDHTVCAIFTYRQDTPILLDAYWSRYSCYVNQNGGLYSLGSGGAQDNAGYVLNLKDDALQEVFEFGCETADGGEPQFYQVADGIRTLLDEEYAQTYYDAFGHKHSGFWLSLPVVSLHQAPTEYAAATAEGLLPYTLEIQRKDFSVWNGPGYDYTFVDTVRTATVYTIVAEVPDTEGNMWGLLKSGLGWVDLSLLAQEKAQPPIISANFSDADQVADKNNHHYQGEVPGTAFTVYIYETVKDMTFCSVYYEEELVYGEPLFSLDTWTPDKAFVADAHFPGDMSMYAIRFTDSAGAEHTYLIGISGRNGALYLSPVTK